MNLTALWLFVLTEGNNSEIETTPGSMSHQGKQPDEIETALMSKCIEQTVA
jgi:hypothetical protein